MPLVSRANHLKGVCAPNSWYHGLNPTRADAEDHQVNEQLLAACRTPFSSSHQNQILFWAAMCLISHVLADKK